MCLSAADLRVRGEARASRRAAGLCRRPDPRSAFREQAGLPTTTCSGMTIVSLPTSCRSSPTSCVTPTCAARARCPSPRPPTTLTWWPSGPGTTWWTKNTTGEWRGRARGRRRPPLSPPPPTPGKQPEPRAVPAARGRPPGLTGLSLSPSPVLKEAIPPGRATGGTTRRWPRRCRSTRTRCAPCTLLDVLCLRRCAESDSHETSDTQTNRRQPRGRQHRTAVVGPARVLSQNAFRPGLRARRAAGLYETPLSPETWFAKIYPLLIKQSRLS